MCQEKLKDALDDAPNKQARDSILAYAVERTTTQSFSISGFNFGVKSKNPMPWDPANFTLKFSFNKRTKNDPTTEYEYTNDYRGSFQYTYSPMIKGIKPFGFIKSKDKGLKFIKEWDINWLPNTISFLTTMSRYYYEMQTRSESDITFRLPVSVSKNFLWDRQFAITWNITKSLALTFNSNTSARIDEPVGAVNRQLFPDKYEEWKRTVWKSILSLGTPWSYNQTFTGSYKAPFSKIPVLDFLTANVSYNATYRWDRGATVGDVEVGNTIASQASWSADGRFNFESLYKKIPFIKDVDKRFSSSTRNNASGSAKEKKAKKFERSFQLKEDTTLTIKHNLRTKKIKVTATLADGTAFPVKTRIIDNNSVEILTKGKENLKFTINEVLKDEKPTWRNIGEYVTRFLMMPRNFSVRWRSTHSLTLPLFANDIGDIFGQSTAYGPMSPGVGFAFGFFGEDYITTAKERGWLMLNNGQTSPAIWAKTNEINFELTLEPIKGLKITLTSNRTESRNKQMQFMYDDMPTTLSGTYTKTHIALATALRGGGNAGNNYNSDAFNRFLEYIPQIGKRIENQYIGTTYPTTGFMKGNVNAGQPFNPQVGTVSQTSSDVLIPAFLAAYSGYNPNTCNLSPFPSLSAALPNWRLTYDGFIQLGNLRNIFKAFTITHAYQCTYSVGSYSSYLNWIGLSSNSERGFTLDEATNNPIPSSPYNISSVAITEKFAPLIGVAVTLKNDMTISGEYRDSRTLTLNSAAGQIVEANQRGITASFGYKIIGFNSFLKIKGSQQGISNDLSLDASFTYAHNNALIRKIETAFTQATSGTRTININVAASYIMSKRLTLGAFFDHQTNTPLVSSTAYPTSNTSFGFTVNLSLAR